ncbi:hypothetical protein [Hutsoniella sourekii]|uniref:hypothetical protein n=1 Tax=Hutsoniella sourekii TaxID=87650 RepID=UPI0004842614|nr:hypothetical protein [Hutsoniella sourekii]
MKKFLYYFIFSFICLGMLVSISEPVLASEDTPSVSAGEGDGEQVIRLMDQISRLNKANIQIRLSNLDSKQVVVQGDILVDNLRGDADFDLEFYSYQEPEPSKQNELPPVSHKHRIRFLTYRYFDLVYFNQVDFLWSTGFFDQAIFNDALRNQINDYRQTMTLVDPWELDKVKLSSRLLASLPLFPQESSVQHLTDNFLKTLGPETHILAERIDIPGDMFKQALGLLMNLDVELSIQPADHPAYPWEVKTSHRFQVKEDAGHLQLGVKAGQRLDSNFVEQLRPVEEDQDLDSGGSVEADATSFAYDVNFEFNSQDVTRKLTKVDLVFDSALKTYQADLEGIAEFIHLNIFNRGTASIDSAKYCLELSVTPSQQTIPEIADQQVLTNREFDYLLTELINH